MDPILRTVNQRLGPTNAPTSEDFARVLGMYSLDGASGKIIYMLFYYQVCTVARSTVARRTKSNDCTLSENT